MNTSNPTLRVMRDTAQLIGGGRLNGNCKQIFSIDRYHAVYDNICTPIRTRFDADDNTFLFIEL